MKDETYPATATLTALLLALLWLNPFTYGPTLPVVQSLAVWVGAALCGMVWALGRVDHISKVQTVAAAWLLAASASAGMGLLQYLGYAAHFSPWLNFVEAGQAYANLRQRNQQATLLAIGLCALLWWQTQAAEPLASAGRVAWWRGAVAVVAVLLAAADAASGSRTGLFQLLLLMALCVVWRRGRATLVFTLLAYALAAALLPRLAGLDPLHSGILGRIGEASSPCASRLTLWSNVLQLIAHKPWLGWGWEELGYAHFMTLYDGPRFCEIMGNAHNLPLHLAVVLGLPLALLLCGTALWLLLRARPWREQDATRQMAWGVLAVIGLHSLLEYPLWYGPFQLAALLALWLLWPRPRAMQIHADGAVKGWLVALAAAVLLACAFAAWDYWRISQIYLPVTQRDAVYQDDTLEKIRPSWLFAEQVQFAELGITPLTPDNAQHLHALAKDMLHFSPEASVVAKVIDSARLLGRDEEVAYFKRRFQAAYPQEYAAWVGRQ